MDAICTNSYAGMRSVWENMHYWQMSVQNMPNMDTVAGDSKLGTNQVSKGDTWIPQ